MLFLTIHDKNNEWQYTSIFLRKTFVLVTENNLKTQIPGNTKNLH